MLCRNPILLRKFEKERVHDVVFESDQAPLAQAKGEACTLTSPNCITLFVMSSHFATILYAGYEYKSTAEEGNHSLLEVCMYPSKETR